MYQLEIDGEMLKREYKEVRDITPWFDCAIALGARSAVMWLRREGGDCHVIARHPIPQRWVNHKSIKRGASHKLPTKEI